MPLFGHRDIGDQRDRLTGIGRDRYAVTLDSRLAKQKQG
jgi:hypothetical protein